MLDIKSTLSVLLCVTYPGCVYFWIRWDEMLSMYFTVVNADGNVLVHIVPVSMKWSVSSIKLGNKKFEVIGR